jgi:hypothetical protein
MATTASPSSQFTAVVNEARSLACSTCLPWLPSSPHLCDSTFSLPGLHFRDDFGGIQRRIGLNQIQDPSLRDSAGCQNETFLVVPELEVASMSRATGDCAPDIQALLQPGGHIG